MSYHKLTSEEYPTTHPQWRPMEYIQWVKRSFVTSLLAPEEFLEQTSKNLKILVKLPKVRLTHHFSGQISGENRIICMLLNPRQDTHSNLELFRILFQPDDPNQPVDYQKENSEEINQRIHHLAEDKMLMTKIVDNFWEDETNRFPLMPAVESHLRNTKRKIPSWSRFIRNDCNINWASLC